MSEGFVFVRAMIMDELPSGQVQVAIYANNADGIRFYTNPEHVLTSKQIASNYNFALQGQQIRETMQYLYGVVQTLANSENEHDKEKARLMLPKIKDILYPLSGSFIQPLSKEYNSDLGSLNVDEISQHKPHGKEADND